jgi:hypothetical protein
MSRTVTALYDTRAEAEAARERLQSAVDVESRAKIIDKSSSGSSDFRSMAMSHEDRHVFSEGLNRGGFMLCAEVDNDESADKIVSVLEQTSGVDLDERQDTWRKEGWEPYSGAGAGTGSFATGDRNRSTDRAPTCVKPQFMSRSTCERSM